MIKAEKQSLYMLRYEAYMRDSTYYRDKKMPRSERLERMVHDGYELHVKEHPTRPDRPARKLMVPKGHAFDDGLEVSNMEARYVDELLGHYTRDNLMKMLSLKYGENKDQSTRPEGSRAAW